MRLRFASLVLLLTAIPATAQPLADTLFAWRGYGREGRCHVRLYESRPKEDRPHVVVLGELAANGGPSILADARYLVEDVGRSLGVEPEEALWIFHWGSFSFEGAEETAKEVLLRATFRRTTSGALGAPSWRVVTREEVEVLTDRQFR